MGDDRGGGDGKDDLLDSPLPISIAPGPVASAAARTISVGSYSVQLGLAVALLANTQNAALQRALVLVIVVFYGSALGRGRSPRYPAGIRRTSQRSTCATSGSRLRRSPDRASDGVGADERFRNELLLPALL